MLPYASLVGHALHVLPKPKDSRSGLDRFPQGGFMTSAALGAIAPVVLVVLLVAGNTGVRGRDGLSHRGLMASVAFQPCMSTIQLKTCTGVVVEIPHLPVPGVVTPLALGPEATLVGIHLVVAGDAV